MNKSELPEGATLTDLFIYPLSEAIDPQVKYERKLVNFAYMSIYPPCEACVLQIAQGGMRAENWTHICPKCRNYLVFREISNLVAIFDCDGKNIREFWRNYDLHYYQKSSYHIKKQSNPLLTEE